PPPPELGYTITAKDLDEEKKAAISKIQKVLETPADTTSTQPAASTATLSSFLAGPLPRSTSSIPVINLDPSPGSSSSSSAAPAVANSLLEALKMKISVPASSTSAANTTTGSTKIKLFALHGNQTEHNTLKKALPKNRQSCLCLRSSQPSSAGVMGQPSVLNQVLAQVSKVPTSIPAAFMTGPTLFGQSSQISTTSVPSASTTVTTAAAPAPASSSQPVRNTNPLLTAGFKPIFAAATTTSSDAASSESKPLDQTFKPIFPLPSSISATSTASTLSASNTTSVFGLTTSSSTIAPPSFSGFNNTCAGTASLGAVTTTQPAVKSETKSLFGSWSTPSTTSSSSASVQPPSTGSTFQFGAAATTTAATTAAPATTTSNTTGFSFGATQPDPQAPKGFPFGQTTSIQNTTSASFGGFAMANTVSTAAPTSTTQSTFTFGKPAFEATAAQPTFSSSSAPSKPFTFGAGGASTPAAGAAPAPASFTFGAPAATATTAAPSFGTPAKPAFGASSTGFAFGTNAAPSAAPPAAPSFGTATQTQSSSSASFAFGSAAPQLAPSGSAQPATGTSTPSFGLVATPGPTPFGSPATPVQGFNAVPFGSPATPTFSIGAGPKPSGAQNGLTVSGHSGNVTCLDFSSNGKYLASCADDRTVRIWSTKDFLEREHKCLRANVELDHATLVRFSPDSRSPPLSKLYLLPHVKQDMLNTGRTSGKYTHYE
ncbi:hypothetical protein GOODEAATRI_022511, partial [Goodea atripinnis]